MPETKRKPRGPSIESKKFVELWVSALVDKLTRDELYSLVMAAFPHIHEEGKASGKKKMVGKMYAINATIAKRTGGKKLRYPDDPTANKGPKGEFKQYILGQADDWEQAGLFDDDDEATTG